MRHLPRNPERIHVSKCGMTWRLVDSEASCAEKKRFRNRKDAARARKKSERLHQIEYDYYRCNYCFGWHVGRAIRLDRVAFVCWLPRELNRFRA